MGDCWVKITIRKTVQSKLRIECKKEFLRHHPEFEGARLTDNLILTQIVNYYLIWKYTGLKKQNWKVQKLWLLIIVNGVVMLFNNMLRILTENPTKLCVKNAVTSSKHGINNGILGNNK